MKDNSRWNLVAALIGITVFGMSFGLMYPLLSLVMEQHGLGADVIGYNAAMQPLGIILAIFMLPRLTHRFGNRPVMMISCAAISLIFVSYAFVPILWGWFGLRLLHGFFVAVVFAISEAWIITYCQGRWAARILAFYGSILSVSFGVGPLFISLVGIEGAMPFVVAAGIPLLGTLAFFLVRQQRATEAESRPQSIFAFIKKWPYLAYAAGIYAIVDSMSLDFLSVYGVEKGLPVAAAALTVTAFVVGTALFQIPIGWLADAMNRKKLLALLGLGIFFGELGVMAFFPGPLFWILLGICGACSAGANTIALAVLGDKYDGADLVTGTSAFLFIWGVCASVTTFGTGIVFEHLGPNSLPIILALFGLLHFMLVRISKAE